jgi:hypothetical protein
MESIERQLVMARRADAEARVRNRVMVDSIGGAQELMQRNVGARLAMQHEALMTSVSEPALGAHWQAQRDAARVAKERADD